MSPTATHDPESVPHAIPVTHGWLATTARWSAFLFVTGALVGIAAVALARVVGLVAALPIAWASVSMLLTAGLYVVAARGGNPGAIMHGDRARALQLVLAPYRFVAWCITRVALRVRPALAAISEVSPGIFLGMRLPPRETARLEACGVRCVVDLAAELPLNPQLEARGFERMHLPVLDRCAPTLDELELATQWAVDRIAEGKKVYLHCAFGRGRSAMVTAAVLIRLGRAESPDDAVAQIQRARPLIGVKGVQYQRLTLFAARHAHERR